MAREAQRTTLDGPEDLGASTTWADLGRRWQTPQPQLEGNKNAERLGVGWAKDTKIMLKIDGTWRKYEKYNPSELKPTMKSTSFRRQNSESIMFGASGASGLLRKPPQLWFRFSDRCEMLRMGLQLCE